MTDQLAQACRQFEAVLIKQTLVEAGVGKTSRFTVDADEEDGAAGASASSDSSGSDVMQSLFADSVAQAIANADRSGLGRSLSEYLEKVKS